MHEPARYRSAFRWRINGGSRGFRPDASNPVPIRLPHACWEGRPQIQLTPNAFSIHVDAFDVSPLTLLNRCKAQPLRNTEQIMNGKIVRKTSRGFGFIEIQPHADEDVFFHCSALANRTMETISEGEEVEFDLEPSPKGPRATNIRVI